MSDNDQKGFIVYGDTKAVIDELTDEQAGKLFRGMLDYFVDGTEPKFSGVLKFVFIPIRQQMDRNSDKYEKRCEKNRENIKKRWEHTKDTNVYDRIQSNTNVYEGNTKIRTYTNYTNTNTNTNTNINTDTDTERDTDTNTESPKSDESSLPLSLLSYLNSKIGTEYRMTEQIQELIETRLNEGYTADQMRSVIDKKYAEWSCDGKMRSYLRPSTLFGDRFEEYLNAPVPAEVEDKKRSEKHMEELRQQLGEKESELKQVDDRLHEIISSGRYLSDLRDECDDLKVKSAVLEQEIESLKRRTGAA